MKKQCPQKDRILIAGSASAIGYGETGLERAAKLCNLIYVFKGLSYEETHLALKIPQKPCK